MTAAIEDPLEGSAAGVSTGIVAVGDRLYAPNRRPLLVLGKVDIGQQLYFPVGILPAGDALVFVHGLDEFHEFIHVGNTADAGRRVVGNRVAQLADRNDVGLAAAGEDNLSGTGSDISLVVDVCAFHLEAHDGTSAAEDRIGLHPGRGDHNPVGIGRQVQDLVVGILAGHLVQGRRVRRKGNLFGLFHAGKDQHQTCK